MVQGSELGKMKFEVFLIIGTGGEGGAFPSFFPSAVPACQNTKTLTKKKRHSWLSFWREALPPHPKMEAPG